MSHRRHVRSGGLEHVVRTRLFVTDIKQGAAIAKAHKEAFGNIMPATSMVEVARVIDPEMLVEIEADAILEARSTSSEVDHE